MLHYIYGRYKEGRATAFLDTVLVKFDCYIYAKNNPTLFYAIDEALEIEQVYSLLSPFSKLRQEIGVLMEVEKRQEPATSEIVTEYLTALSKDMALNAIAFMEGSAKANRLDKKLLLALSMNDYSQILQSRLNA